MSRRRKDDGAALVESAFALPIVFLFVLAMVDLGAWGLNSSQATNAARDGARAALLRYETADIAGSDDHDAIVAAISANLPGRDVTAADVTVTCVDSSATAVVGGCAAAQRGVDRVRVTVDWAFDLLTPMAHVLGYDQSIVEGTSTVVIVGRPIDDAAFFATTTTAAPPPSTTTTTTTTTTATTIPTTCVVTNINVVPDPVESKPNGNLQNGFTVTVTTNGQSSCDDLDLRLTAPNGSTATRTSCGCSGPVYVWSIGKNDHAIWSAGTATAASMNGATVVASTTFGVT